MTYGDTRVTKHPRSESDADDDEPQFEAEDDAGVDDSDDDGYEPSSDSESDSDEEEEERQAKRRRYVGQLPADVSEYVTELVQQQADVIASGLIDYIEEYHPRLRSELPTGDPSTEDLRYRTLFEAYTSYTEREETVATHFQSGAYDEDADVVGRTSVTYDGPPIGASTGRQITPTSVKEGMKQGTDDADMTLIATTFEGKWKETLSVSPPRLKWNDRTLELLTQLSTLLFAKVSQTITTEEVEAMAVNGRVLVSANEVGAVKRLVDVSLTEVLNQQKTLIASLKGEISQQNATTLAQTMSALGAQSDEELTEAQRDGVRWLAQTGLDGAILDDDDETEELSGLLEALYATMTENLKVVAGGAPESAAALITGDANAGTIIVVDAWEYVPEPTEKTPKPKAVVCSHAEQNLVYALVCSGHKDGAQVAGKKRPCTACSVSLQLADDAGYAIKYNPHPGGYWEATTHRGLQRIAQKVGVTSATQLNEWVRGIVGDDEFRQYITLVEELDGPPDEIAATSVIGKSAKERAKFSTAEGSQSIDLSFSPPRDGDDEDDE
jgi:hypothetical protein